MVVTYNILHSDERHGKPGFATEKKPPEEEEEDLNDTNYDEVHMYANKLTGYRFTVIFNQQNTGIEKKS